MFNPVMTSELVNGFGGVCYDKALVPTVDDLYDWYGELEEMEMEDGEYRFFCRQLHEVKMELEAETDPEAKARLRDLYSDLHKDLYGVRPRYYDFGCAV